LSKRYSASPVANLHAFQWQRLSLNFDCRKDTLLMPSLQLDTAIELARADDYPNAIEQLSLLIDRGQGEEDDITARRWRSVCYGQSGRMKEALTDANG